MTRNPIRLLVLTLAAALAAVVVPATAQAAPYCGITWGSLAKQAGNSAPSLAGSELTAVRAGQQPASTPRTERRARATRSRRYTLTTGGYDSATRRTCKGNESRTAGRWIGRQRSRARAALW